MSPSFPAMQGANEAVRIGVLHSFYRSGSPSGENTIVEAQVAALLRAGHDVQLVAAHSDQIETSLTGRAALAFHVATHTGQDPAPALKAFRPDVVHVHNLFPNFGYSWLERWPGPLVATLHNFRPFCAQGSFFRDGTTCLDCLGRGGSIHGLLHRCYRDSLTASALMTLRNRRGVLGDPLLVRADRLVVLSEMARDTFIRAGVRAESLHLIPNGLPDTAAPAVGARRRDWLYVGRLSPEKGVLEAVAEWPAGAETLFVVGDGPLREQAEVLALTKRNVEIVGPLDRQEVAARLAGVRGLLIPSRCRENLPTVMLEALRSGTPLVARRGNAAANLIDCAAPGDAPGLAYVTTAQLQAAVEAPQEAAMQRRARRVYEQWFREDVWVTALEGLYRDAQESRSYDWTR